MFFAPLSFPHMPYLEVHEDNATPINFVPRADQTAYNFSDTATELSDLFSSLTCSDTALTDLLNSEASDVRTIDGSSRLFSRDNLVYLLPLGTITFFIFEYSLIFVFSHFQTKRNISDCTSYLAYRNAFR